ncbi:hypothetical protein FJV41_39185 [Myxococcus llanfairpwllgwyngyllgogerychwyrndrobwllllantysiliogogogochensis]|uniref:Uncharacterized protein n=1 Tax=Myxococcus llanfairpwllgwyngyllgogerychwyrndrobwllllantysiliogogogochensis TaxID=2590453 RepID=A0A540WN87_9BACT|nr:hypothetical protein [Myxococcus llanfairpwllgwyngyllgogerychwyrndrobwllllantysiliogogogochensis]TQF10489.1 hypothetical protein FJV41_39185 [Myxococcus llanfairpwllgwyngyllgogerychwyrndrobwllllantysiliogogogochensis]
MGSVNLDAPCSKCGHVYQEHNDGSPCTYLVPFWGVQTECGCREFTTLPVGGDFAEPKPWHDCPACPSCKARCGIPARLADWNHRAAPTDTLVCPSCGAGWVGTAGDVAQAERAYKAWAAEELSHASGVGHA